MKKIASLLFILILAFAGLYVFKRDILNTISQKVLGKDIDLSNITTQSISTEKLQSLVSQDDAQLNTLSERGREVGEHVSKVLGESIQADDGAEVPIHERAFEYGRYIYCKEVVKDYEDQENQPK